MPLTKIDDRGLTTPVDFQDNEQIRLGTGNDFKLYHDGSHSYLTTRYQTHLRVHASEFQVKKWDSHETMARFISDGAVKLYHNNSQKFETTATGATITGNFLPDVTDGRNLGATDKKWASAYFKYNLYMADDAVARFGDNDDLQIHHNGTNSHVKATNGALVLNANSLYLQSLTEDYLTATANGAVNLYYDNSKKFETTSTGVSVTGKATFPDGNTSGVVIGNSGDFRLFHNGSHSYIENDTGNFIIDNSNGIDMYLNSGNDIYIRPQGSENGITLTGNGAVELYYDSSKKFETSNGGVKVYGDLRINDNENIYLGDGADLHITVGANNDGVINQANGDLKFQRAGSGKFSIKSTGTHFSDDAFWADSQKAIFGAGNDLEIYHNGSHSIAKNGTGDFYLAGDSVKLVNAAINEDMLVATANGSVDLNHNNSKKFETTTYGTRTTGYHTQSTAIGFQGDNADWTSTTPHMHNLYLHWTSGHFVNSTGVFTCPVAGKYLCSASVQAHRSNNPSGSNGQYYNVIWQKNSSNYHTEMVGTLATDASSLSTSDVNGKHETVTATVIIDCAENDTIRAHSNHGYRHNSQNICSVYLLG